MGDPEFFVNQCFLEGGLPNDGPMAALSMRKASPKAFYRLMSDVFVTSPATLRFCLQMATNILVGIPGFSGYP